MAVPSRKKIALLDKVVELSLGPADDAEAFEKWIAQSDSLKYLANSWNDEKVAIYASIDHVLLHAVLTPKAEITDDSKECLLDWSSNAFSTWGVMQSSGPPAKIEIVGPMASCGSAYEHSEQLVYLRTFEGRDEGASYAELLQKFVHLFGLHFLPERNSYCRLDKHGDIEDVVSIHKLTEELHGTGGTVVLCDAQVLFDYATLGDCAIVRMFDLDRFRRGSFHGWGDGRKTEEIARGHLIGSLTVQPGTGSYLRGVQFFMPAGTKESVVKRFWRSDESEKEYATFIAHDRKNNKISVISCDPNALANYFTKSDLPFEISPAFFRPEVLLKYKANTERYKLKERSIECRGAWHLKTYDINAAGQVHTYLRYLSDLPYEEQLYWKSFNVDPRDSISKRAFRTDIEGDFYLEETPLAEVKKRLRKWKEVKSPWWKQRGTEKEIHLPATESKDEWADELLHLDQLVIEGFVTDWLRKVASTGVTKIDTNTPSLTLLEHCLVVAGLEEAEARAAITPLKTLRHHRNKLKGHASGQDAIQLQKDALKTYGSYRDHFEMLCASISDSLNRIDDAFLKIGSAFNSTT